MNAASCLAVIAVSVMAGDVALAADHQARTGSHGLDDRFVVPDSESWKSSSKPLAGRTIAVLVADDFNAVEAFYPIYRWREAGARIIVVGAEAAEYSGRGRYPLTAEKAADDLDLAGIDIVFVPGGDAPKILREDPGMVAIVRDAQARGIWIAAACHGPQLLAKAGLLEGRRITAWPDLAGELKSAGAEWVDETVVRDGRLITSQDPWTMDALAFAVIDAVSRESAGG